MSIIIMPSSIDSISPTSSSSSRFSIDKTKDRLKQVTAVKADSLINFPKLAIDVAMSHIKTPPNTFGHSNTNTPRVFSDLGASVFSMLFKAPNMQAQIQHTVGKEQFLTLIETIERYVQNISSLPSNLLVENMRKHKKFIDESIEDLEFLEQYFGSLGLSKSAIISFKKLNPVDLEIDL